MEQLLKTFLNSGVEKLLLSAGILIACLLVTRKLLTLFDRFAVKLNAYIDSSLQTLIRTLLRITLDCISVTFAASNLGISLTSLVALFSVVGISVSLAVQGLLANFAGGIIILVSKPFHVGDYIETDSACGTVEKIGYLHTMLYTLDGKRIYIPNNVLYTTRMTNYTSSGKRRLDLTISASYHNTPDDVREACMNAVKHISDVLADPAPDVVLTEYGDSAIQYMIRAWVHCEDFQQYRDVRFKLNEALYEAFKQNGVEMTYPHINVHMK